MQSKREALRWLRMAAQGVSCASTVLGDVAAEGSTEADAKEAAAWYAQAAKDGVQLSERRCEVQLLCRGT